MVVRMSALVYLHLIKCVFLDVKMYQAFTLHMWGAICGERPGMRVVLLHEVESMAERTLSKCIIISENLARFLCMHHNTCI